MKLIYCWINKFRDFENEGFNFSSNLKVHYSNIDRKLEITNIKCLPKDFYGSEILDVTGVIGKNGTGKSNLLELVCMLLKGAKSLIESDFFVITEESSELICYYSGIKPISDENIKFKLYKRDIDPLNIIYFSNVFDQRKNTFSSKVTDLSMNRNYNLINNSKKNSISEFSKQVSFITDEKSFSHLDIDIPKEVLIINKVWDERPNRPLKNHFDEKGLFLVNELKTFFRTRLSRAIAKSKFIISRKYSFCMNSLDQILSTGFKEDNNKHEKLKVLQEFNNFVEKYVIAGAKAESVLGEFIEFIEKKSKKYLFDNAGQLSKRTVLGKRKKTFQSQIEFIRNLENEIMDVDIRYTKEGISSSTLEYFTFKYTEKSKVFLKNYVSSFNDNHFLELGWLGISSGHKAYLNMFASIHHELKSRRKESNLLLCIDEGDLYLHPKWQIEFFEKIRNVLPEIYKLGKIQLIMTSHSPFLLSNFPTQSTIILDREKDKSIVSRKKFSRNTFGGNLYDLYEEQFFLGDTRSSTFSENKINNILEKINKGNISIDEKIEIEKIIDIIGDNVIQYHLKKKLKND